VPLPPAPPPSGPKARVPEPLPAASAPIPAHRVVLTNTGEPSGAPTQTGVKARIPEPLPEPVAPVAAHRVVLKNQGTALPVGPPTRGNGEVVGVLLPNDNLIRRGNGELVPSESAPVVKPPARVPPPLPVSSAPIPAHRAALKQPTVPLPEGPAKRANGEVVGTSAPADGLARRASGAVMVEAPMQAKAKVAPVLSTAGMTGREVRGVERETGTPSKPNVDGVPGRGMGTNTSFATHADWRFLIQQVGTEPTRWYADAAAQHRWGLTGGCRPHPEGEPGVYDARGNRLPWDPRPLGRWTSAGWEGSPDPMTAPFSNPNMGFQSQVWGTGGGPATTVLAELYAQGTIARNETNVFLTRLHDPTAATRLDDESGTIFPSQAAYSRFSWSTIQPRAPRTVGAGSLYDPTRIVVDWDSFDFTEIDDSIRAACRRGQRLAIRVMMYHAAAHHRIAEQFTRWEAAGRPTFQEDPENFEWPAVARVDEEVVFGYPSVAFSALDLASDLVWNALVPPTHPAAAASRTRREAFWAWFRLRPEHTSVYSGILRKHHPAFWEAVSWLAVATRARPPAWLLDAGGLNLPHHVVWRTDGGAKERPAHPFFGIPKLGQAFLEAALQLHAALALRYADDSRVDFVDLGVIGSSGNFEALGGGSAIALGDSFTQGPYYQAGNGEPEFGPAEKSATRERVYRFASTAQRLWWPKSVLLHGELPFRVLRDELNRFAPNEESIFGVRHDTFGDFGTGQGEPTALTEVVADPSTGRWNCAARRDRLDSMGPLGGESDWSNDLWADHIFGLRTALSEPGPLADGDLWVFKRAVALEIDGTDPRQWLENIKAVSKYYFPCGSESLSEDQLWATAIRFAARVHASHVFLFGATLPAQGRRTIEGVAEDGKTIWGMTPTGLLWRELASHIGYRVAVERFGIATPTPGTIRLELQNRGEAWVPWGFRLMLRFRRAGREFRVIDNVEHQLRKLVPFGGTYRFNMSLPPIPTSAPRGAYELDLGVGFAPYAATTPDHTVFSAPPWPLAEVRLDIDRPPTANGEWWYPIGEYTWRG
jgi:hypothetical protein